MLIKKKTGLILIASLFLFAAVFFGSVQTVCADTIDVRGLEYSLNEQEGTATVTGFAACSQLTDVMLPAGLSIFEDHAFAGCGRLTGLRIPASVKSIGETAFAGTGQNAGSYKVSVTLKGNYSGTAPRAFTIKKAANPLKIKAKTAAVKYSRLKKKAQTLAVSKVITFTKKGQGKMTYTKASGSKKITINKKTGKVTIKKGLKKGTYKVKIKAMAAGNTNYKVSAWKTVTAAVIVK